MTVDSPARVALSFRSKTGGRHAESVLREVQSDQGNKNPKAIVMKNKKPATQGVCPTCSDEGVQNRERLNTTVKSSRH